MTQYKLTYMYTELIPTLTDFQANEIKVEKNTDSFFFLKKKQY